MAENDKQMAPAVSIIIPTYNRCRILEETLASLADIGPPQGGWEIIVVNNNSPDDTATVLEKWEKRLPEMRWVIETLHGLSNARNRGIAEARAQLVIFIDDDVLVSDSWIGQLLQPFANPEVWCVGGAAQNVFPDGIPRWMEAQWKRPYCPISEAGLLPDGSYPIGANMAFRRDIFEKIGTFDPDLGRKGNAQLAGEESELVDRLRKAGGKVWFVPEAKLIHQMPSTRMNLRYALQHGYDSARSRVYHRADSAIYARGNRLQYALVRLPTNMLKVLVLSLLSLLCFITLQPGKGKKLMVGVARGLGYCRTLPAMLAKALIK